MRLQGGSRRGGWWRAGGRALIAFLAVLASTTDLAAQTFEYEVLFLHPPGLYNSYAKRINEDTREVVGFSWTQVLGDGQALLWTGAGTNVLSLNPGPGFNSQALDGHGKDVGGVVRRLGVPHSREATAWRTDTGTRVSLHPTGMVESAILGAGAGQFVGWEQGGESLSFERHALLWTGREANAIVDLHPRHLSFVHSQATDIDRHGRQQVGFGDLFLGLESIPGDALTYPLEPGTVVARTEVHALLWSGTAASAVDLHPAGFASSLASATDGYRQVGYGAPSGDALHALLWEGSAASVLDLHPAGFDISVAFGLRNSYQVGVGRGPETGGEEHALLWQGRPDTVVDLHRFLPDGYVSSGASDVDEFGNVTGGAKTASGEIHAVIWRRRPDLHSIWPQNGTTLRGGRYAELLVVLDGSALGDAYVALASSEPFIAVIPVRPSTPNGPFAGTLVPSGSQTTVEGIWLNPVAVATPVILTATYRGVSVSATLTVVPANLESVSVSPGVLRCGQSATGTVVLDGPAPPAGAAVQLAGSMAGASWPSSVTIPGGSDQATFSVRTFSTSTSAGSGWRTYTVTATYRGLSRRATLKCSD